MNGSVGAGLGNIVADQLRTIAELLPVSRDPVGAGGTCLYAGFNDVEPALAVFDAGRLQRLARQRQRALQQDLLER